MPHQQFASYDDAMAFLFTLTNYEKGISFRPRTTPKLGLERTAKLLEYAGNPQDKLRAVHIAGTKGKGSTASMVANTLTKAGYKTGLFISPHVEDVRERIQINGQWIPCDALTHHLNRLYGYLKRSETREDGLYKPTFFETFTAIGFMHFVTENVDFAVAEVGMGGRLDTTNVLMPMVCGITPVGMDHMEQLGHTLAAIAGEKAGIIKNGVPVVCGRQKPESLEVISRTCEERNAPLYLLDKDFHGHRSSPKEAAEIRTWNTTLPAVRLAMPGSHQMDNAAMAAALLSVLKDRGELSVSDEQIHDGLSTAFCPARIECVRSKPLTIVDSSHNTVSIHVLLDTLRSEYSFKRLVCVFAVAQDKEVDDILRLLCTEASHVVFTSMNNPRASDPHDLAVRARALGFEECSVQPVISEAIKAAEQSAGPDDLICICGSFYLAGDARKLILDQSGRIEPTLQAG